jgi:putative transposase
MDEYRSLSHTVWDCKHHVVWIPKCRRKVLYEQLRKHLGQVFRTLALQKESKILEGRLMADHVHMLIPNSAKVWGLTGCWLHQR